MNEDLFRADLHCHSTCSDGTFTPEQLIYHAKEVGLHALSITDHDTIDAYNSATFDLAHGLGLHLLPGVEISTKFQNQTLHVLAYGKGLLCKTFQAFLDQIQIQREERNRKILQKLTEKNMPIEEKELKEFVSSRFPFKEKNIGRPHIALLMMEKKYVGSFQEAFDKYIKDDATCYERGYKYDPLQVIEEVHRARGLAVIAHPHFLKNKEQIRCLLSLPFDGIECYYSRVNPIFEKKWVDIADRKNLIKTGGSDFHGTLKPHVSLGCSWVGKETFFKIYDHE